MSFKNFRNSGHASAALYADAIDDFNPRVQIDFESVSPTSLDE